MSWRQWAEGMCDRGRNSCSLWEGNDHLWSSHLIYSLCPFTSLPTLYLHTHNTHTQTEWWLHSQETHELMFLFIIAHPVITSHCYFNWWKWGKKYHCSPLSSFLYAGLLEMTERRSTKMHNSEVMSDPTSTRKGLRFKNTIKRSVYTQLFGQPGKVL